MIIREQCFTEGRTDRRFWQIQIHQGKVVLDLKNIIEPGGCPAFYIFVRHGAGYVIQINSEWKIAERKEYVKVGFTKWELVQFFDGLTELVSEENKEKAKIQIRKFFLDFEKRYQYEDAVIQRGVPYLPPYFISVMPQAVQEEIREKLTVKLTEQGEYTPERVEQFMNCQINDLKELIDIREYVEWADREMCRHFQMRLEASRA